MATMVDCDTTGGSQGCNDGFNQYGISYIGSTGIAAESAYPYTARDGTCRASSVSKTLAAGAVSGYKSVAKTNAGLQSALKTAPASVTVDSDNSWQLYRSGVLSKSCGLFGQSDHAVIAVGYDTSADTFKIRSSWGASWGKGGCVRVDNSVSNHIAFSTVGTMESVFAIAAGKLDSHAEQQLVGLTGL